MQLSRVAYASVGIAASIFAEDLDSCATYLIKLCFWNFMASLLSEALMSLSLLRAVLYNRRSVEGLCVEVIEMGLAMFSH
jgi:hypothetical protein